MSKKKLKEAFESIVRNAENALEGFSIGCFALLLALCYVVALPVTLMYVGFDFLIKKGSDD